MKLLTVVGARPQFIKAAAVSRALAQRNSINEYLLHTGQHYDLNMSDIFFDEMKIKKPDYQMSVTGKTHGAMTAEMLAKIESVCLELRPDLVMVYGDTNSTLAGALAAAKLNIPLVHVEAGLRSFNMAMPEEINRIVTDRLSGYLFCPTDTAVKNLEQEGFQNFRSQIIKNGDVMYDAALFYSQHSYDMAKIFQGLKPKNFILCTIHRAENTDSPERLASIFAALREIARTKNVILPLHPRTRKYLDEYRVSTSGITLLDPVGYFDMLEFLKNCEAVLTDSGGLQKEAYFFSKPCLILRSETEWVELLNEGHALTSADTEKILNSFSRLNSLEVKNKNIYGSGNASDIIADTLLKAAK